MANLFTDNTQLTSYVPGQHNLSLEVLQPAIDMVLEHEIADVVTKDVLDATLALLDQEEAVTGNNLQLVHLMRRAVAHLAIAKSTDDLNVRASAGGFTVNKDGDVNAPASMERVRRFYESRAMDAQVAMDDLIAFMDRNADDFGEYAASPQRRKLHKHFINSTEQLHSIMVIKPGRWVLQMMAPVFEYVEEKYLRTALCDELYEHLKTLLAERDGVTATTGVNYGVYAPLIRNIELVVAHYGMLNAIQQLGLKLNTTNGLYKSFYRNANEPAQSTSGTDYDILKLQAYHERMGNEAMSALSKMLNANAEDFPLYANSACYTNGLDRAVYMRKEDMNGGAAFIGLQ